MGQPLEMRDQADASAIDPVCGMSVDPEAALARGLHAVHEGTDYYFCSRGCKLDFEEDPKQYLAADYQPTM